jgi:RNA polymerase sigma factor (sigma-70 family)
VVAVPSIGRASHVTLHRAAPEADATRDLYERFARQIYTYCLHQLGNKEEAEDATQSTFLNAFRGYKRGVDPEFESAWLYKIAQNVCLTRQRSSVRRRRVESPGDLDAMQDILPSHETDPDTLIRLPEALEGLPAGQRRALLLREWQGLSYKEIAEELDLSQAAVETLLFRARRSLAAGLVDEPSVTKRVVSKLRAGSDAGSFVALLQAMFSFGGAKVAATVATVAATSVVAASPTARHAVEQAVTPVDAHRAAASAPVHKSGRHAAHHPVAVSRPHLHAVAPPPVAPRPAKHGVHVARPAHVAHLAARVRLHIGRGAAKTPDATSGVPQQPAVPPATQASPPVAEAPAATPATATPATPPAPVPVQPTVTEREPDFMPVADPTPAGGRGSGGHEPSPTVSVTPTAYSAYAAFTAWATRVSTTEHSRRGTEPTEPAPATTPTTTTPATPTDAAPAPAPVPPSPTLPPAPIDGSATPPAAPPQPSAPRQGHRR